MNTSLQPEALKFVTTLKEISESHQIGLLDDEIRSIRIFLKGLLKDKGDPSVSKVCHEYWNPKASKDRAKNTELAHIKREQIIRMINTSLQLMGQMSIPSQIEMMVLLEKYIKRYSRSLKTSMERVREDDPQQTEESMPIFDDGNNGRSPSERTDKNGKSVRGQKPQYKSGRHPGRTAHRRPNGNR